MVCSEMWIFSIWYLWAFSALPYRRAMKGKDSEEARQRQGSVASLGRYLLDVFSPVDIIRCALTAFKNLVVLIKGRERFDYSGGFNENYMLLQSRAKSAADDESDVNSSYSPYQSRSPSPSPPPRGGPYPPQAVRPRAPSATNLMPVDPRDPSAEYQTMPAYPPQPHRSSSPPPEYRSQPHQR